MFSFKETLSVIQYQLSREDARQLAVGLYRQVGSFVAASRRNNPEDYARFKAEYEAKQVAQTSAPKRRTKTLSEAQTAQKGKENDSKTKVRK